jgi:hypothetical protein
LISGLIIFRLGAFFRYRQSAVSVACVILGYALIFSSIVWTIMKITFMKNPEDDTD